MGGAPRRAKPCIMMKFVAAKTINQCNLSDASIVTASHRGQRRCGLVRAQFDKSSEAGFAGFYDLPGLGEIHHGTVPIPIITKS